MADQNICKGHIYLYIINNDLHTQPYALIEDLYVEPDYAGEGIGTKLLNTAISSARKEGCYKIIANSRLSRERIHTWYTKIGFVEYGKEFRMDLR